MLVPLVPESPTEKVVQLPNMKKKMHGDQPKMTADLVVARALHAFDGESKKIPANQPKAPARRPMPVPSFARRIPLSATT